MYFHHILFPPVANKCMWDETLIELNIYFISTSDASKYMWTTASVVCIHFTYFFWSAVVCLMCRWVSTEKNDMQTTEAVISMYLN